MFDPDNFFRCLVKNPEYRPFVEEILEHPLLTEVPEKNYHVSTYLCIFQQKPIYDVFVVESGVESVVGNMESFG